MNCQRAITYRLNSVWRCTPYNNSLDASGGSVFLNLLGAAKSALIRAAASTQPLAGYQVNLGFEYERTKLACSCRRTLLK
jgi:hypothetical protein